MDGESYIEKLSTMDGEVLFGVSISHGCESYNVVAIGHG